MSNTSKCKTCKHGERKRPFNDIKCMKKQHFIYDEDKYVLCDDYEPKDKKQTNEQKDDSN